MPTELIIPPGYGQATFRWSLVGKTNPITSTLGYWDPSGLSTPAEQADNLYESISDTGAYCDDSYMLIHWTFLGVDVHFNTDGVIEGASSSGPPIPGTIDAADNIVSGCVLAQKKSTRIGRQYRGRMYLPPINTPETQVSVMGEMAPAMFTQIASQVGVFSDNVTAAGITTAVILHSEVGLGPTTITSLQAVSKMATQRRRLRS
jgi:hypothetical protein